MRIYLSDYDVFVDEEEARQYIEMNNVLKFNQIAVETKKIEAIIQNLKTGVKDDTIFDACGNAISDLQDLLK